MKQMFMLATALMLLVFTNCEKEDPVSGTYPVPKDESIGTRSANDVTICHLTGTGAFQPIQVNANAVQAHLGHGDYLPDADGDGYTVVDACIGSADDCDDTNAGIHPGAEEICGDGVDQNCDGQDEACLYCPCFSKQSLEDLLDFSWSWGWWSDVPGCKDAPFDNLLELWITGAGLPNDNFNFSAQAGTINGSWFASSAIFNHETNQFDLLCGGYTSETIAEPCRQILSNFIQTLRTSRPDWDYCIRFP